MSEAKNFAVVDAATLVVDNVILAKDGFAIDGKMLVASDTAGIGDLYDEATGQFTRPEVPEPAPTVDDYKNAIVAMLDAMAQQRRYDNAVSISTYVNSTNPQWAAEAAAYVAWRDAVWVYAYAELMRVETGQRPQPSVIDFLAELPSMVWSA
ncbi:hypothetical protein CO731_04941 [Aminobacter sp. MSH1]|uniref:hypothetical protein n=1 Tax=Aminobacter sp. MSH1 TaxID=374606 RepID=UPI000D3A78EC|nr:hypothetical protein [Aminobacter sp. MSH1]AWC25444.1 hypothetical protein CO731_04941 [Aminobacter sp. MSH1]